VVRGNVLRQRQLSCEVYQSSSRRDDYSRCPSPTLISKGGAEIPDLLIIDFGVNDHFEEQDWFEHGNNRKNGNGELNNAGAKVFAATEALLRYVLKTHPTTAVAIVEAYCIGDNAFSRIAHKKAALMLGVPYISYSRLTRHGCNQEACGGKSCFRSPHPPFYVHERVKVGLSLWWEAFAWRLKCRTFQESSIPRPALSSFMLSQPPMATDDLVQRYKVCERSMSTFDARAMIQESKQSKSMQGWPLTLDRGREDKAAWIATEDGSIVEFPMSFGQSPRVALVYTKGYDETFGEAEITMPGNTGRYFLSGCCNHEKVTQGELVVMNVGQSYTNKGGQASPFAHGSNGHGFGIRPFTNATLRIKFIKSESTKFSISFLSSC